MTVLLWLKVSSKAIGEAVSEKGLCHLKRQVPAPSSSFFPLTVPEALITMLRELVFRTYR